MDLSKYFSLLKKVKSPQVTGALGEGAEELAEKARMGTPGYSKYIQQDELGQATSEALEPEVLERGFTMPHADAQLPVVQPQIMDDIIPNANAMGESMLPVPYQKKASNLTKGLTTAGALGAGALGLGLMDDEQAAPAAELPVSGGQTLASEKVNELPKAAGSQPNGQATSAKQAPVSQSSSVSAPTGQPDYMADLKAAQGKQQDLDLIDNMLRAGTTIGSAISKTQADYAPIDALQKQNSRGVDNVKQLMASQKDQTGLNDDKTLRDPASDVSKAFRATLAKLGIPHTEKTTAWDAKAMGINPQNLLMQDRAIDKQMKMMDMKQGKERDNFVTGAQKSLMKPYQQYQKVANARSSLEGYLKGEPSGPKDVAILYDFIKGLDPESAVKEGEIQLGKSAMSLFEQYGIEARKLTRSDILSPKFRTAIADIMKSKEEQARSSYEDIAQPFKLQGASRGLQEEDYGRFDYMSAADAKKAAGQPQPAAPQGGAQLVERKTSDGKIALFDPTTKQFVKYKDQ